MMSRTLQRTGLGSSMLMRSVYRLSGYRLLSRSTRAMNEVKQTDKDENVTKLKKRPLSRVAIGGSQDSAKKFAGNSTIEFASWKAVVALLIVGGGITYWFLKEKERLRVQKEVDSRRSYGKPLIGGNFSLVDCDHNDFTQENLKNNEGKFSIIYFGFTHCPDVCPDELDKLGVMIDSLKKDGIELQPLFITCDPNRDTPEVVKEYLQDFHPSIKGLTGSYDKVKNTCKKFRVYFSTPPNVKPGQDYLVDHSIFFYLMDPEGNFVDVIGREADAQEGIEKIKGHIDAFIPESERQRRKDSWFGFLYK